MNFESVLSSRDGAEAFRSFLQVSLPHGLTTFQIWLTLNGYIKEYNRYRLLYDSQLDNFIRWNVKCAKALIEKFFKNVKDVQDFIAQPEIRLSALNKAYRQCRKFPTLNTAEQLKSEFVTILTGVKSILDNKYFDKYCKTTEVERINSRVFSHLSLLTELNHNNTEYGSPNSDLTSSDNYSSVTDSTQVDWRDKKKYRRRQKVRFIWDQQYYNLF